MTSSYTGYDRSEFFDPTYLNPIPMATYDFYPPPQPIAEPVVTGEPV